jgi:DNA-binding MarR family transcriptional regulator
MTKHLPEWIMIRYSKLWSKFKEKEFTREQAEKTIPSDSAIAVFFSELKKAGWIEMKMSQEDARKTVYKLKDPTKAIIEEINELNKK